MKKRKKILSTMLWIVLFGVVILSVIGLGYDLITNTVETFKSIYRFLKVGLAVFVIIIALVVFALNLQERKFNQ